MNSTDVSLFDLDHVATSDGRIYRVVGNLDSRTHFLGYNVYSQSEDGDRLYRGDRYRKNYIEDDRLPSDVLDTYELVAVNEVTERHEPVKSARSNSATFKATIWFDLYEELVRIFGDDSVGIFGSSMFGLHLTPEGHVRKDVDFVIQGMSNVEVLRQALPGIRARLGFTTVTTERQLRQHARYQRVFRNENNSIQSIIARRWTGLQLSEHVVTTIRLRDPSFRIPVTMVSRLADDSNDVVVSGCVADADGSNLFPRKFRVLVRNEHIDVYVFWWKFSTPVRDGDAVTLCGSLIAIEDETVIRLTNFSRHWLRIDD